MGWAQTFRQAIMGEIFEPQNKAASPMEPQEDEYDEQSASRQNRAAHRELGVRGLSRFSDGVSEEFIRDLRWPRAGKVYKEMSSNDPVITAILFCNKQLLQNVNWSVKAGGDTAADKAAAAFLKSCMDDMDQPWTDFIEEVTSYFEYGWSLHEMVFKKRDDGLIGWAGMKSRAQSTLDGWEFDEKDNICAFKQRNPRTQEVYTIPMWKCLLFRTTSVKNNPEGKSFLRGAYRPWYFKKHIEEIEAIGIERDLAGIPIIKLPEGVDIWDEGNVIAAKMYNSAVRIVTSIKRDKNDGVVLPFGWDLTLLGTNGKKSIDTNTVINRYDQRIAITMISDIIMLGADKVGSFALASTKKSLLATALDTQAKNICEVLNRQAIPLLFTANLFPGITALPTIESSKIEEADLGALGDFIQKLTNSGAEIFPNKELEEALLELARLPKGEHHDRFDDREKSRKEEQNANNAGNASNNDPNTGNEGSSNGNGSKQSTK